MRAFTLPLFLLFGFLGVSLPAAADPPSWAPAHGWRAKQRHRYVYYPSYPIYYAPERRRWFWLNGGNWLTGAILPWGLRHHLHDGVSLYYDTPYPYYYHHHTLRRYPRRHHHYSGQHFNRPFDYGDRWPGEWNYWDRRPDRGHHDRDRDRHHGRGGRNSDYDRHRYQERGRHDGRHDGGRDGRHDGRHDGSGRHDRRQQVRPRSDHGPGSEFHRTPRKDGSARGDGRGRQPDSKKEQRG